MVASFYWLLGEVKRDDNNKTKLKLHSPVELLRKLNNATDRFNIIFLSQTGANMTVCSNRRYRLLRYVTIIEKALVKLIIKLQFFCWKF